MSTDDFHNLSLQYFIVSLPKSSLVSLPLVCRKACPSTRSSLESTSSDLLMKNSLVCVIKLQWQQWPMIPAFPYFLNLINICLKSTSTPNLPGSHWFHCRNRHSGQALVLRVRRDTCWSNFVITHSRK